MDLTPYPSMWAPLPRGGGRSLKFFFRETVCDPAQLPKLPRQKRTIISHSGTAHHITGSPPARAVCTPHRPISQSLPNVTCIGTVGVVGNHGATLLVPGGLTSFICSEDAVTLADEADEAVAGRMLTSTTGRTPVRFVNSPATAVKWSVLTVLTDVEVRGGWGTPSWAPVRLTATSLTAIPTRAKVCRICRHDTHLPEIKQDNEGYPGRRMGDGGERRAATPEPYSSNRPGLDVPCSPIFARLSCYTSLEVDLGCLSCG